MLVSSFGASRDKVKLDSKLEYFFSEKPKLEWKKLEKGLGCGSLPRLVIGKNISLFAYYLLPFLIISLFAISELPFTSAFLVVLIYYIFAINISHKYGYCIPDKYETVKGVIPLVSSLSSKTWQFEEIVEKVMELTAEQSGLSIVEFTEHSHFIDEIGLD